MKYKYELHCHTGNVSSCAVIDAADLVKMYREAGYSGLVVTDHYNIHTFKNPLAPRRFTEHFLSGYRRALDAAGEDFTVLLGMEIRFYGSGNDYLVYGLTEDFLRNNGNLMVRYPRRFHKLCEENGMLFIQAHPFRPFLSRTYPGHLDGCEIFNAKDRPKGYNEKAEAWAEKYAMSVRTGGADLHRESQKGNMSGIMTETPIKTNAELISVLKSGSFEIIK